MADEIRTIDGVDVRVHIDSNADLVDFIEKATADLETPSTEESQEETVEAEEKPESEKTEREKLIEEKNKNRANQAAACALSIIDQYQAQLAEIEENYYVYHGAKMICSCGSRMARLVVEKGHGAQIKSTPQLVETDCKSLTNIMCFGNCMSPENPKMMEEAEAAVRQYRENHKVLSLGSKIKEFFIDKEELNITPEMLAQCICECEPCFGEDMKWLDCRKENLIDGKAALLTSSTIHCMYGGMITICSLGLENEEPTQ